MHTGGTCVPPRCHSPPLTPLAFSVFLPVEDGTGPQKHSGSKRGWARGKMCGAMASRGGLASSDPLRARRGSGHAPRRWNGRCRSRAKPSGSHRGHLLARRSRAASVPTRPSVARAQSKSRERIRAHGYGGPLGELRAIRGYVVGAGGRTSSARMLLAPACAPMEFAARL